jgi:AcrR family transcriptional regulator
MASQLSKSELSRRRVLDSAAKIFRDYGYVGTTMRAIADEADLQAGSLYYHFKSKDDLISAVLDMGIRTVSERVRAALEVLPDSTTGRERLKVAVHAHLSASLEVGDYSVATRRVMGQVPEAIRAKNQRQREAYGAIWRGILEQARSRGEFRTSANLNFALLYIFGALNWVAEWFRPGGRTIDEIAAEFSSFILDGLMGSPGALATALPSSDHALAAPRAVSRARSPRSKAP